MRLLIVATMIALGVLIGWGFLTGRQEAASEAERERTIKVPIRASTENGEPVIRLDEDTLRRSGIETATLPAAPHDEELRAYGVVLDVARLTELSNSYATAKAQVQTAQAKLASSKPAFERAQKLISEPQAVSQAQLQAAQAAYGTDQASLAAAESQLRTLAATAYQEWGPVLGRSLVEGSPDITRLIERQDFLLQVSLPPGVTLAKPPAAASIETGKGSRAAITFVSPATRIDPKIQGVSFFFTAPAESGVLPGMNVLGFLPSGRSIDVAAVPASAVVWWQGRAWVYRRTAQDTFARTEIATDRPMPDGGYLVKNLPDHAEIVTRGAQLLLSEEFRAQIQVED
ncbi:efflux RND transporter periplasmic adaptor subunit [Bradyrhizobium sp. STM 3562]|uniref:efflux RND transporter periplasmic adaptor subunit n=1 Tax=Bradyrhizobium sp. STM 3562 TaxID=578924 RepID=UPI003890DB0B